MYSAPDPTELSSLSHVGLVVRDLEVAAKDFERRWGARVEDLKELELHNALYYDRPADISSLRGSIRTGGSEIELIQPLSPRSPYVDFLRETGGDGVHHLAYVVTNIEHHLTKLQPTRAELMPDALRPDGARFIYVAGFAHGPVIELVESPEVGTSHK